MYNYRYLLILMVAWLPVSLFAGEIAASSDKGSQTATVNQFPPSMLKLFALTQQHSPMLHAAQSQQVMAQYHQSAIASMLKPELSLNSEAGYAWVKQNEFSRFSNQLQASYPLYQPSLDARLDQARFETQQANYAQAALKQEIQLKVAQAALNYWSNQAELTYLEKEKEFLTKIYQQAKQRFQVGYQDLNSLSEMETRIEQNMASALKFHSKLEANRANMHALVGAVIPWQSLTAPDGVPILRRDSSVGLSTHPAMMKYQQAQQAAEANVDYQRYKDGVSLKAFGAMVNNNSDGNYYDDMEGMRAGIKLSIPIYTGGSTDASVQKAKAMQQGIGAQQAQQMLLLETARVSAEKGYELESKRLDKLNAILKSRKQASKSIENGLQTGVRDMTSLLDAVTKEYQTEKEINLSRYELWRHWSIVQWSRNAFPQ